MRVWMDMANSPHPMLLGPVSDELERQGHEVWVTARDHAQTVDLTLERWPSATVLGGGSPSSRRGKVEALIQRIRILRSEARRHVPDVALSLNSYSQVVAARLARVPCVTLMDYEYQPANHLSFRLADRVVVPSAFPSDRLKKYGARSPDRVRRFDGYKEELYLDDMSRSGEQSDVWAQFGSLNGRLRCLFRPPPEGATYHRTGNALFDQLLSQVAARPDVTALVLPRFSEQRNHYSAVPGVVVPAKTVPGLSALRSADIFVGAGGTMCREAALLGVPAYTVFAGRLAAVDRRLIEEGLLHDLRAASGDISTWVRRVAERREADSEQLRERGERLREDLLSVVYEAGHFSSAR